MKINRTILKKSLPSRRTLASLLVGAFLLPLLTAPATASAAANPNIQLPKVFNGGGTGVSEACKSSSQNEANQCEELKNVHSVDDLKGSSTRPSVFAPAHDHLETMEVKYFGPPNSEPGFQPRSNTAPQLKKFKDNPYLEWTGDGNVRQIDGLPARFVLSQVQVRSGDSGPFGAVSNNHNGTLWIFQNEYNPNIKFIFWNRADGNDFNRLSYTTSCQNANADEAMAAGNNSGGGLDATNGTTIDVPDPDNTLPSDDQKKIDGQIKRFKLGDSRCHVSDGTFAGLIQKALEQIKEGISTLFDWIKNALLNVINVGTLTHNAGLVAAWKTFRDLVNIFFILVLIAIAFSNMLRVNLDAYGARALLPRLVFAVIAVNFSFLLVQIMVNFAYILSSPFLSKALGTLSNPPASGSLIDPSAGIGQFLITLLLVLVVLVGFVILFFFFIVRILVIWLLAALSPLVFLFMVLPATRSLASMWWKNAIKWIFMAPVAFMILFVASEMLNHSGDSQDINGPDFLLQIAFFAGAAFAAVMVPFKLGGEIMGRAAAVGKGGGKGLGKFGIGAAVGAAGGSKNPMKFGRQGGAYLEQRKANQEQEAKLGAVSAQSRLAGVRGIGGILTGGSRGTTAAQGAAAEKKYGGDIEALGADTGSLRMLAENDQNGLENSGQPELADLASKPAARRAAGRMLSQKGLLHNETARRAEMYEGGVHEAMRPHQPVIGNMNRSGTWNDEQMGAIASQAQSSGADATKQVHWSGVLDSLENGSGEEKRAARHYVANLSNDALAQNLDESNPNGRNFISADHEREALKKTLVKAGHPYKGSVVGPSPRPEDENQSGPPSPPPSPDGSGGPRFRPPSGSSSTGGSPP